MSQTSELQPSKRHGWALVGIVPLPCQPLPGCLQGKAPYAELRSQQELKGEVKQGTRGSDPERLFHRHVL